MGGEDHDMPDAPGSCLMNSGALAPSPCISLCRMDPLGKFCVGCRRTLAEIAGWTTMTEAQRWAVLERLADGAEKAGAAGRGGG